MRNRILISPNSFKECADSVTIAELIRDNLINLKETELIIKPISDGGDGFLNVCKFHFGGDLIKYTISTAFDNSKFECPVLYCKKRMEIYVESAEVLGLKIVPLFYRNPLKLTSKGMGELLMQIEADVHSLKLKVNRVYIGIGGTATIDMGMGMISVLGLKLIDSKDDELDVIPKNFQLTQRIDYKPVKFSFELMPIVDVKNPLLGPNGGIRTFGKQKKANDKTISTLEEGFSHLLNIFENNEFKFYSNVLSGAGGGIPVAFQIFYKTSLLNSSEFIGSNLGLWKYSTKVDYLITGEGAFDSQSNLGKGAGALIDLFKEKVQRLFLLCGRINKEVISCLPKNVYPLEMRRYFSNEKESIEGYKKGIRQACKEIVKRLNF